MKLFKDLSGKIIAVLLGAAILIPVYYTIHSVYLFNKGYDSESDKTANINVMLKRPDNWYQIDMSGINLPIKTKDMRLIDGSTATVPITAEIARQFLGISDEELNDNMETYINHNTTGKAYCNLIHDKVYSSEESNILFATAPSSDELEYAKEYNVKLKVEPVALDGFVFIVNKDNPVDCLTVSQIQDIYSGKITNWKELGGEDADIIPYQREKNSGSQTAMENMVMEDREMMNAPENLYIDGMGMLIEYVAEYHNSAASIGYTYNYYINNLYKNDNIKVLSVDGIFPDNDNFKNGLYPFTTTYNVVTRDNDQNIMVSQIHDFILSDKGQELIELAGYCPVR